MPSSLPRHPWGWTPRVRVLIGVVAVSGALWLGSAIQVHDRLALAAPPLVVDANTAPRAVLEALPRVGPVLAGRIVAAREDEPFRSLDDLDRRVRGIGPVTIAALRPFLRVGPDTRNP